MRYNMTELEKFSKRWAGVKFMESGSEMGEDGRAMCRSLRRLLTEACGTIGASVEKFRTGHYEAYAFVRRSDGSLVFVSFDDFRCRKTDMDACGAVEGVLVRTAESVEDYHGGRNTFCSLRGLAAGIECCK